jgi:hypothetical protein
MHCAESSSGLVAAAARDGDLVMELVGSREQQLVFLITHWGGKYLFSAPRQPGGEWAATAKFGPPDRLQAESARDLLEQVRWHYQVSREQSYSAGL